MRELISLIGHQRDRGSFSKRLGRPSPLRKLEKVTGQSKQSSKLLLGIDLSRKDDVLKRSQRTEADQDLKSKTKNWIKKAQENQLIIRFPQISLVNTALTIEEQTLEDKHHWSRKVENQRKIGKKSREAFKKSRDGFKKSKSVL